MSDVRDVIVIGGGPAGYTAALYAARANLKPLVIEGFSWGGQLMVTSDVENYPGYPDGIMGPEMMAEFRRQAERFGSDFLTDDVTRVDFSERPFRVWAEDEEYRARPVMVERAHGNEKIEFKTPFVVEEVLGEESISGLRLRNTETGETEEVDAGALFVAIGHDPNTKLFLDQLDHDPNGYLIAKPGTTETNVPGVFAAGDVQDHVYRQAVTAAGSGCMAALDAERFLAAEEGHSGTALTAPRPEAEPTQ